MVVVGKRGKVAWKTASLSGTLNEAKEIPFNTKWWNLTGYEIQFPAVYTGTITFTKVVADTTNESNKLYTTLTKTDIRNDAVFDPRTPIFMANDGDSLTITSSASITGVVEITIYYEGDGTPDYI